MKKLVFVTLLIFSANVYSDVFLCTLKQKTNINTDLARSSSKKIVDDSRIYKLEIVTKKNVIQFGEVGKGNYTLFRILARSETLNPKLSIFDFVTAFAEVISSSKILSLKNGGGDTVKLHRHDLFLFDTVIYVYECTKDS